jgi:hypothetical protein
MHFSKILELRKHVIFPWEALVYLGKSQHFLLMYSMPSTYVVYYQPTGDQNI